MERKTMTMEEFFRPIDWRWKHAWKTLGKKPRKYTDDPWTNATIAYVHAPVCDAPVSREMFRQTVNAGEIYSNHRNNDIRIGIEALIMAKADSEDIDAFLGLESGTAEAYEKVFYDVREFLFSPTYVRSKLVSPPPWHVNKGVVIDNAERIRRIKESSYIFGVEAAKCQLQPNSVEPKKRKDIMRRIKERYDGEDKMKFVLSLDLNTDEGRRLSIKNYVAMRKEQAIKEEGSGDEQEQGLPLDQIIAMMPEEYWQHQEQQEQQ